MSIEAMELALEALDICYGQQTIAAVKRANAITALRQAIKQAEVASNDTSQHRVDEIAKQEHEQAEKQEPVVGQPLPCPFCGHVGLDFSDGNTYRWGIASCGGCGASRGDIRREYPDEGKWHSEAIAEWNKRTAPPPRQPLTEEEIQDMWRKATLMPALTSEFVRGFARAIEAAHGIKREA